MLGTQETSFRSLKNEILPHYCQKKVSILSLSQGLLCWINFETHSSTVDMCCCYPFRKFGIVLVEYVRPSLNMALFGCFQPSPMSKLPMPWTHNMGTHQIKHEHIISCITIPTKLRSNKPGPSPFKKQKRQIPRFPERMSSWIHQNTE